MKKFGFGSMRLPCNSDDPKDIDLPQIFEMVDRYIEKQLLKDIREKM